MKGEIQATLLEKLADALVLPVPVLTRCEIRLPKVPGKALAVIGMRRSGKSCFLWQCLADLLAAGEPRESLVYLTLEDDRLAGMDASDLSFLCIGRAHTGHALETAVFIELLRRGCEVHYLRTPQGNEVDFHAIDPTGQVLLVQACATAADPGTLARQTRSLTEAHAVHPSASLLLIVLDPLPPGTRVPTPIQVLPAIQWFLQSPA